MGEQTTSSATLTDEQRRLVRDNLGLVAVHLRRNVFNLNHPKRKREWEDLFQEGCLGLIRAATVFREERGIPFAAFALPRIHNAVSRALQTKFNTIYVPPTRPHRKGGRPDTIVDHSSIGGRRDEESIRAPKRLEMCVELADRAMPPRPDDALEQHSTVGERLREKYERAVQEASQTVSGRACRRGDRKRLVRTLIEERYLVPDDDSHLPLRRIARNTRSSYGRVSDCDKQLHQEIRRTLESDPEFRVLRKLARSDPAGAELSIDEDLERELAGTAAAEFVRRFATAPTDERARMLQSLLELSPGDLEEIVQCRIVALPADARERLLRGHQSSK